MDRLNFMVCPHDTTNNPDKWFLFAQYLSMNCSFRVGFEMSFDFADFHENLGQADLVYANPNDTIKLVREHGFRPLAHAEGVYDEVVFVANTAVDNPTLDSLNGADIHTVKVMLPTLIGLQVLKKANITPGQLVNQASWLSVVAALRENTAEYGFLYKDTYDALSDTNKESMQLFHTSKEHAAFHSLLLSPAHVDKAEEFLTVLKGMQVTEEGREVLSALDMTNWLVITNGEFAQMLDLAAAYA